MYLGNEMVDRKITERVIGYQGDGHLLTIGPTRSGKSRRLLIPNLLYETGRSMLVIDIKGELAAITASHRAGAGGEVVALDPYGELPKLGITNLPSVGYNPLLRLDPNSDEFNDDAMRLAETLIEVRPDDKDPHWAESAQNFVAGLIMLIRINYGDRANLSRLRTAVCSSHYDLDVLVTGIELADPHDPLLGKLDKFRNAKDNKEIQSIRSNAERQTRFLDSKKIAADLIKPGFDFATMKQKNLTVFLVLPPRRLLSQAKWLRLIVDEAMVAMQNTRSIKGRPSVLFMLDEFPQLGRLASIETAVALNAGYGVKVWAAVQHLGQLKACYGENWETFLSAGCVTAFAPRDWFTRDHLTRIVGTGSKTIRSTNFDGQGGTSYTDSVQKDDLLSAHDWRQMIQGEQWAFIPTDKGQLIKRIYSPDFTDLPEVKAGKIKIGVVSD